MDSLFKFQINKIKLLTKTFLGILFTTVALVGPLEAFEVNKGAIPLLHVKDDLGQTITMATGFVVKPEGILLTNYHILIGAHAVEAIFPDGSTFPVKKIYKVDRTKDFAVLQLDGKKFSTLPLGNSDTLQPFNYTSALGYPYEEVSFETTRTPDPIRQTFGMALGTHPRTQPDFSILYTTAPLSPGFSGGPLIDKDNQVIALGMAEGRSINLALPINYVKPFLSKISGFSFEELRKQDEKSIETLYYQGSFELYEKSNPETALAIFKKVLSKKPKSVSALYDSAVAYRNLGRTEKAIDAYEKALRVFPHFPAALSNLGGQYFRSGKLEKAIESFQKAVNDFPNFIEALSNLGATLNKLERYAKALPHLEKTVRLNPEFAMAQFNLGNAYFGLENYPAAKTAFKKAANLGLNFVSLHWNLFKIHQFEGKNELAARELEYILEIDPENDEALSKLNGPYSRALE